MSQDFNTSSRKARRAGRGNRSRPVLVTPTSAEQDEQSSESEINASSDATSMPVQELPPLVVPTPTPTQPKARKLPGFLPALGKSSNEEGKAKETKDIDPAQARIARATRKIPAVSNKTVAPKSQGKSEKVEETKPARPAASTSKATSTRPASAFKTRYIFGMVLYLLCANFIGVFETSILQSYHLDSVLTQFNLFGGNIIVRTSTLVFLATLVIILIVLARLDLIPRSLGAATGAGSSTNKASTATNRGSEGERAPQPTMRQGVKGESDDLYQQYRSSQRRQKK